MSTDAILGLTAQQNSPQDAKASTADSFT